MGANFATFYVMIKSLRTLENMLGLTIENNLDFTDHISNICKTANQKPNALYRVSANMNSDKCSLLIKVMKKVNKVQEVCLHLIRYTFFTFISV